MSSIQYNEALGTEVRARNARVQRILVTALVISAPFLIGAVGGNYWVRVLDFD